MNLGVFLGFWPFLTSVLSLTGGASLALETGRGPHAVTLRMVQYGGVEGADLRLSRADILARSRWKMLEGGVGGSWLRLSSGRAVSAGLYPVLSGGVRFGRELEVRLSGSALLASRVLWSTGLEAGIRFRLGE